MTSEGAAAADLPLAAPSPDADPAVPGALGSIGRWLARAAGRVAGAWRTSMQLRVVSTTLLLCLLVVLALGAYLYRAIGSGLENDRIAAATREAQSLTQVAQQSFDSPPETTDQVYSSAVTLVQTRLAPPGADQSRYVILTPASGGANPGVLGTISTGGLPTSLISPALRAAVRDNPTRQQVQIVEVADPLTGQTLPSVIVGTQVQVPIAGTYDLYFIYPMRTETATLSHISSSFIVGGLALLLLIAAVAWVVARQVVVPVRRASVVAERLAAGDFSERMDTRGQDEIAVLGKSFDEMADSLQSQIQQLETLSRFQQRFVSDVSHELRTPLTTVRMAADLIHDARGDFAPGIERSAELLQTELNRFEALLADLLEISRFDAGAAALDTEPTDLVTLVDKVVEASRPLAEAKGSLLSITGTGDTVADIDPRRVERILRNLVVNAIEHGEGKPIRVYVAANDAACAVVVEDRGVGLRPGEALLVFNRFWRADPARARTTGGTGLGLAIALEDARLHDGWLQAWGEPGRGSRFRLTLPRHTGQAIRTSPLSLSPRAPR